MPFFKDLSDEDRQSLSSIIGKKKRYYSEFISQGKNTWGARGDQEHFYVLSVASFVSQNLKDFKRDECASILSGEEFFEILEWYRPVWLSTYLNEELSREYLPYYLGYGKLMKLKNMLDISLEPGGWARALVSYIFPEHGQKFRDKKVNWKRLLNFPETLDEHIWYLFQYETDIHWTDQYGQVSADNNRPGTSWSQCIADAIQNGKLDRMAILKESVLASNRNFNKNLSGWFINMFEALQPSKEELLEIQEELFSIFSAPHSKPINSILKLIKGIVQEKEFDTASFLENASLLLNSEVKVTVKTTLTVIETIAKREINSDLLVVTCEALANKDEAIQKKAAKLIVKYGEQFKE
ncbi:MAG: DUF6493 family protein, partial [Flavobacteriales bacterium]|nr:DUF6493 family protein [Flavobacteriales bacterium]